MKSVASIAKRRLTCIHVPYRTFISIRTTNTNRPHLLRSTIKVNATRLNTRSMWIQTETTPNQDALKFVPGQDVLGVNTSSIEFLSSRDAHSSPLAKKLFTIPGVKTVFYGPDFITVTKEGDSAWPVLKPEIFSLLMEYLSSGQNVMSDEHTAAASDTAAHEDDDEIVTMIKELLDSRIRPAIQEDGGDIEYRGFEEGTVKLKLRGACRTCDSSTVTLKNGIESMLMHYVPEVERVEQVLDPEEQMAEQTFEEFEASLKKKREAAGADKVVDTTVEAQSGIGAAGL